MAAVLVGGKKLSELRVVDLRQELEKRGLEKSGVKAVLTERLHKVCGNQQAHVSFEGSEDKMAAQQVEYICWLFIVVLLLVQALLEEGTSSTEDKLTASTDSEAQLQEEEDGQEGSEERTSPTTKRTPRAKKSPPSELL